MNKQHCWYNLNIDISNAVRPDFDFGDDRWYFKRTTTSSDMFTVDWLEYMRGLGIPITATQMFQREVGSPTTHAHIDVMAVDSQKISCRTFAINWAIGGRDSEMIWYDLPNNDSPVLYTRANTPYVEWSTTDLTEVDRCCIQSQPTVVRVDVPHSVKVKDEPRISISVRTNGIPNDWDTAVDYLLNKQILIPRY